MLPSSPYRRLKQTLLSSSVAVLFVAGATAGPGMASDAGAGTMLLAQSTMSSAGDRATTRTMTTQGRAELRDDAPTEYVVKRGDTLWDIANVFLKNPLFWPEIWLENLQVRNPHLIYPGDVLRIVAADGQPRITVDLEPRLRVERDAQPIDAFIPFMFQPHVVDDDTLDNAPYILSARDERVIFGPNDTVFVRNMPADTQAYDTYHIVRRDRELIDPETEELLGVATVPIGEAEVVRPARANEQVAITRISKAEREALRGDRLLPLIAEPDFSFPLSDPPEDLEATVILLFEALTQIGRYQVAVINRGSREGVEPGNLMRIWESGRSVRDPIAERNNEMVQLPEEEIGDALVFATFEKVSYVLVTRSIRPVRENYRMYHPRTQR